ncbi:MAG: hypothetical protein ACE14M_06085 [Terriglobales bacterium]
MTTNNLVRVVCWMMIVVFPASMIAADITPAMLRSTGTVKVNGRAVNWSSIAYVGDQIQTGRDSTATITVKGAVVSLPSDSGVVYAGNSIQMQQGRALVNTYKGLDGRLDKLTISPASQRAKYQMTRADGKMLIAAVEGSLSITDGTNTVLLTPGNALMRTIASDESSQAPSDEEEPPPPGRSRKRIPGWIWVLGGVGGIFVGTVATGVFESASPSRP